MAEGADQTEQTVEVDKPVWESTVVEAEYSNNTVKEKKAATPKREKRKINVVVNMNELGQNVEELNHTPKGKKRLD